jgi:hypothetical protein
MARKAFGTAHGDPPPVFAPHEQPTPAELAEIARQLLRERAQDDAQLAAQMKLRGIALTARKSR